MTDCQSTQKALLTRLPDSGASAWSYESDHPVPVPTATQVLVKTSHAGLNPFDWQAVSYRFGISKVARVMGRDGAGIVVKVGSDVKDFKQGDRVWFCANSALPSSGAFQEYSTHNGSELGHTPDNVTNEQAATLGTGLVTAGVTLFKTLEVPFDSHQGAERGAQPEVFPKPQLASPWILVWGGAGITGIYLIQLARLLGYRVICAASPVNHEYVKSLGAEVVLDRWSERDQLLEDIRKATNDDVKLAIDNVGKATATICQQVLAGSASWRKVHDVAPATLSDTSRLVALAGSPAPHSPVNPDAIRQVHLPRISFSTTFYGHPEFSRSLLQYFKDLLASDKILPARPNLIGGGLRGVETGLDRLRNGRGVGGHRLVVCLRDRPVVVKEVPAVPVVLRKRNAGRNLQLVNIAKRQKVSA